MKQKMIGKETDGKNREAYEAIVRRETEATIDAQTSPTFSLYFVLKFPYFVLIEWRFPAFYLTMIA